MDTNHILVLYCCTFSRDLLRTIRLVQSVQKYNIEKIPFYLSVPDDEVSLFKNKLNKFDVFVFGEKKILRANPKLDMKKLYEVPGSIRQQVKN